MEKTVKEICLICKGERWIPFPQDPGRSQPCPYCDQQGWVEIAPACLEEPVPAHPKPRPRTQRKGK
jgi:hypothetical protein